MPLTTQQFAKELESMVSKRRAFWDHPWIQQFRRAELSKDEVRHWIEQQFYVTGRVYDLIGPLYVNCEDAEARTHILDNLIEEETGRMSKSAPHPELYIRLGCALGSTRDTMCNIYPTRNVGIAYLLGLDSCTSAFCRGTRGNKHRWRGAGTGCWK
jgi:pyrroloquinoline-quinone synthase